MSENKEKEKYKATEGKETYELREQLDGRWLVYVNFASGGFHKQIFANKADAVKAFLLLESIPSMSNLSNEELKEDLRNVAAMYSAVIGGRSAENLVLDYYKLKELVKERIGK